MLQGTYEAKSECEAECSLRILVCSRADYSRDPDPELFPTLGQSASHQSRRHSMCVHIITLYIDTTVLNFTQFSLENHRFQGNLEPHN